MSVFSDECGAKPAGHTTKRRFWHGLAERLDALAVYPTKHAVTEQELRRVDDDMRRCRQLMIRKPQKLRNVKLGRVSIPNAVRAMKAK
jgi:hypothetical protein